MNAFIINIGQLFKMDTNKEGANFAKDKRKLLIPLYQREYKWTNEKIQSLIRDIQQREKFLGNVILDEVSDCYEIVDGQQRITTCFLLLISIYNFFSGQQREQENVKTYIQPYNDMFVLQNNSVGDFIIEKEKKYEIAISNKNDVYFQKDDFMRAVKTIDSFINSLDNKIIVQGIKKKLLDCEILVLINNKHNHVMPIEQIFLDINEKAQLLEAEDIFKGHCFENYEEDSHNDLRNTWIDLKKCGMKFKNFGYDNLSKYIYLYFLEYVNIEITEKLTLEGKHYLEGKSEDETDILLHDMIDYGKAVTDFYFELNKNDYRFDDICVNSKEYRNTGDHIVIKIMCKEMLEYSKAQYQKFPLMHFIYFLKMHEEVSNKIKHNDLRKIITNLYIYMSLFIMNGGKKSKKEIDHTFYEALSTNEISNAVDAAKELRKVKVKDFAFKKNYKYDALSFVYSIIDFYSSEKNWIINKYTREQGHNLEHFIIPDNSGKMISWKAPFESFTISLPSTLFKQYKNISVNYLIMDKRLNESIENKDIVTKIEAIKKWYEPDDRDLPNHIKTIIYHIEDMEEYKKLKDLKTIHIEKEEIEEVYEIFIKKYFSDEHLQQLYNILKDEFIKVFINGS